VIYLKEGLTPLNSVYSDEIVHEGNSTYQLSFKFPVKDPLWKSLKEETLLVADDLHGEQEFVIFEVERQHTYITVYANQVATLLNNYAITEISVKNANGTRVMEQLARSIIRPHDFIFSADISSLHTFNVKNVTAAEALFKDAHSIMGQWGGDLIRDKYRIKLQSNGGTEKDALFMYKKNLKGYQQKKSIKDLRTRIHFTKTIPAEAEGGEERVIKATVDSPLIEKYKYIYEGNLEVNDQDVVDLQGLVKYGQQYFKNTLCDLIEDNIEIEVIGKPDVPVKIFDTVTVFHESFGLDVKKKITKYTYSPMRKKLKTIGFGAIQPSFGTAVANMVRDAVNEKIETSVDAFKIQKNLAGILKKDKADLETKMKDLEEASKANLEVKKAFFDKDSAVPEEVRSKIFAAVEADIGKLKTIITEAEMIDAIQARLNFAKIKNAVIDKAFINEIVSNETFRQEFEAGEVTTQNIFTKMKDAIHSSIRKDFVTAEGVKAIVNDLKIDADGIRKVSQEVATKVFESKKDELRGESSYMHVAYANNPQGVGFSTENSQGMSYIGIHISDSPAVPMTKEGYKWVKIQGDTGVSSYMHVAYADSEDGSVRFDTGDSADREYIGTYTSADPLPSQNPRDYRWLKVKGDDGVNTYVHIAYSNNPDGRDMNFESNSKYMGIYTGESQIAPADPSEYVWSQIKGADGARGADGRDGARGDNGRDGRDGRDGKSAPNFNLLLKTEIPDSSAYTLNGAAPKIVQNDYNGRNSLEINNNGLRGNAWKGISFNSSKREFKKGDKIVIRLPIYIYDDVTVDAGMHLALKSHIGNRQMAGFNLDNGTPRNQWVVKEFTHTVQNDFTSAGDNLFYIFTTKNGHFKVAEPYMALGDTVPSEWMPHVNELKAHSLVANARIEGTYEGSIIKDMKVIVDVFYDGVRISDGYIVSGKLASGNYFSSSYSFAYNSSGEISYTLFSDGTKTDGSPITAKFDVSYKGLKTNCFARLDNLPDTELIKEVVKKYSTFEHTLEKFKSEVGEKVEKQYRLAVRRKNLLKDKSATGMDLKFNSDNGNFEKGKVYTFIADIRGFDANQRARMYSGVGKPEQALSYGTNFFVFTSDVNDGKVNIDRLGNGAVKLKNVEVWEGDFRESIDKEVFDVIAGGSGKILTLKTTKKASVGQYYKVVFDTTRDIKGAIALPVEDYVIQASTGGNIPDGVYTTLKTNENVLYYRTDGTNVSGCDVINLEFTENVTRFDITKIKVYEINIGLTYGSNNETLDLTSLINQSKDEIQLKVSETLANKYMTKEQVSSEIKLLKNKVETAVTNGNFGTKLTQNANSLRLAWNNISNYIQFENAGLNFYNGARMKTARIDEGTYQFWRDGYYLGHIGTNQYQKDARVKGIVFDLDYEGSYMAWAAREGVNDDTYTLKWFYTKKAFDGHGSDTLNAACDIDMGWNEIERVNLDPYMIGVKHAVTDTLDLATADGGSIRLQFKNGFLINP
jgi:phage minor structural protein, N-terminal domain protein